MTISAESWAKYIADLKKVNDHAYYKMYAFLELNKDPDGLWDSQETRQKIIDYAFGLSSKYGDAAAELACEMFDLMGVLSDLILPAAEPAPTATYDEVGKTINGVMKQSSNLEMIASSVSRLVKLAGVDTIQQNALKTGAEWAWIPVGDTCPFCLMLASNGWQKASKKAIRNGHAEHVHANCDCTYAVRFDGETDVEGYNDGEKYRNMYYDGEGIDDDIWDEAQNEFGKQSDVFLNAMRRQNYKRNKEKINEQKRSAYAKRKELESSRAEELNT